MEPVWHGRRRSIGTNVDLWKGLVIAEPRHRRARRKQGKGSMEIRRPLLYASGRKLSMGGVVNVQVQGPIFTLGAGRDHHDSGSNR